MQCNDRRFFVSFLSYLKPTFKLSHPANAVLIFSVFWISFLLAMPSHSEEYVEGKFYESDFGALKFRSQTAQGACQLAFGWSVDNDTPPPDSFSVVWFTNSGYCQFTPSGVVSLSRKGCVATGYESEDFCQSPTPTCPGDDGSTQTLKTQLTVNYVDGSPVLDTDSIPTDQIQMGQCVYALQDTSQSHQFQVYKHKTDGGVSVWAANEYVFLNSVSDDATDSLPTLTDTDHSADYDLEQDPLKDTSDSVISPENTITDPDGTQVTTQQVVNTETKGEGVQITETQNTTFISETDGIIKEEVTTTTTYDYPDGTSEVVTETHTSYTQSDITNYTIDNSNNRISISATGGSSASQTTTQTDSYDSNGALTGSSTETTGGTDEQVAEEGSFCEENPQNPSCKEYAGPSDSGEYDPTDLTYATVLDSFKSRFLNSDLGTATLGFFDVSISGSCPTWSTDVPMLGVVTFDFFCLPLVLDVIAVLSWALIIAASIAAYRVAIL